MSEKIRCFVAITFPDKIIKEIARIQELVWKKKFDGKLTELENLHLTLKFLGEIDEDKIQEVKMRLSSINFNCLNLKLGKIGLFNYGKNPRIVWIKLYGKEVVDLQQKIDSCLKDLFDLEKRFMGHLTIARIKFVKDKIGFKEHIKKIGVKDINFKIDKFKLIKSELKPQGPVYQVIEEFKIDD